MCICYFWKRRKTLSRRMMLKTYQENFIKWKRIERRFEEGRKRGEGRVGGGRSLRLWEPVPLDWLRPSKPCADTMDAECRHDHHYVEQGQSLGGSQFLSQHLYDSRQVILQVSKGLTFWKRTKFPFEFLRFSRKEKWGEIVAWRQKVRKFAGKVRNMLVRFSKTSEGTVIW